MKKLLILILFFTYIDATDYIDYKHPFHPTSGKSGMVVSQNALSSELGIKILDMGGNAAVSYTHLTLPTNREV